MMTLQFNVAGSWRNVVTFEDALMDKVLDSADALLDAANTEGVKMRVLTEDRDVRLIVDEFCRRRDWPYRHAEITGGLE